MKKTELILVLMVAFFMAKAQDAVVITAYEQLITEGNLIVDDDTLSTTTQTTLEDKTIATKLYVDSKAAGLDSIMDINSDYICKIYLNGLVVDSFLVDSTYHSIYSDTSKVSTNSTYADTATVALNTVDQSVYTVVLPSSNSVLGRIQTPTSLPDGWTLTDDGINLIITHNLDRWSANVTVKSNTSGTIWDQQLNTAAYSYYSDLSSNQIKVYSLCTAYKPIRINIIFE